MIRDRIQQLRRVPAVLLHPHPKNWRTHPLHQRDAVRDLLIEIGYAAALLARELPDGSLELIDGHLRAEITPDIDLPVLIVDLDDAETAKLLALHDPLSAMAGTDEEALTDLLAEVETQSEALQTALGRLLAPSDQPPDDPEDEDDPSEVDIPTIYQVVVECRGEREQQSLFDRLTAEGYTCRLLNLCN